MFFYDAAKDITRFAKPITVEEVVSADDEFRDLALYGSNGKTMRQSLARTRLIATPIMHKGTRAIVDSVNTIDDLEYIAPAIHQLFKNLAKRHRKAVIYTDAPDAYGGSLVYELMSKFRKVLFSPSASATSSKDSLEHVMNILAMDANKHFAGERDVPYGDVLAHIRERWETHFKKIHGDSLRDTDIRVTRENNRIVARGAADKAMQGNLLVGGGSGGGPPLFHMLSSDRVKAQRKNLDDFNKHKGTGLESAILVLGFKFSTGVDVKGAAGEMHVLNVLPNNAMETQVKGRVLRNCSHASLPHSDWVVKYYMYSNPYPSSCDSVLAEYREKSDTVMNALQEIVKSASFGCRLFRAHHGHPVRQCL